MRKSITAAVLAACTIATVTGGLLQSSPAHAAPLSHDLGCVYEVGTDADSGGYVAVLGPYPTWYEGERVTVTFRAHRHATMRGHLDSGDWFERDFVTVSTPGGLNLGAVQPHDVARVTVAGHRCTYQESN